MTTSQDEILRYLDYGFNEVREGDNSAYFFDQLKKKLPEGLEATVRGIIIKQCDFFAEKGIGTLNGYESAHKILKDMVRNYYQTPNSPQTVA